MTRQSRIRPEFVTFAPDALAPGVIYVSMEFATVLHTCCCGCGNTVVTPLAPERWSLTYDGKRISLDPSIGNWSFACQSHYWIERNEVIWERRFSRSEIAAVRAADQRAMKRGALHQLLDAPHEDPQGAEAGPEHGGSRETRSWWRGLLERLRS